MSSGVLEPAQPVIAATTASQRIDATGDPVPMILDSDSQRSWRESDGLNKEQAANYSGAEVAALMTPPGCCATRRRQRLLENLIGLLSVMSRSLRLTSWLPLVHIHASPDPEDPDLSRWILLFHTLVCTAGTLHVY
jgi:hypothetical protein